MKPAFRINSEPVDLTTVPPTIRKAFAFLDKLKFGELVTTQQFANKIQVSFDTLKNLAGRFDWDGRRVRHKNRMLYGSQKTIKAYCAHVGI